ncbi:MAG: hypothetical protein Q9166_005217 [cf. Caloplaca sp. 2 TL-2023]
MPFLNPDGHNFVGFNLDGWGIFQLVFNILYTLILLVLCGMLWKERDNAVIRMRKIPMAIAAVLVLHVYFAVVLVVYPLNGHFPCTAEFWIMSIYLPIGIGLVQAQNQQLLLISEGQKDLLTNDSYKALPGGKNLRQYYWNKFMIWCKSSYKQDAFEGFIAAGMLVQFLGSFLIYMISRKFSAYGIVSQPTTQALCRRGWEWAPSIIWQAAWNFIAGPYLLWKIRKISDIYHWRWQTSAAIVACLPGTPLWLAATYSDKLNGISRYWIPPMWFLPGLITLELVTILGPLIVCWRSRKQAKATNQALDEFDTKQRHGTAGPHASMITTSTKTKSSGGSRVPMKTMEDCLMANGPDFYAFLRFCSTKTFNGENLLFLDKAIKFKIEWRRISSLHNVSHDSVRLQLFRTAVQIYLTCIWKTAPYPINIPSNIQRDLAILFMDAAVIVAARRPSTFRSESNVTPWDEPADPFTTSGTDHPLRPILRRSVDKGSRTELITDLDLGTTDLSNPLIDYAVPTAFDDRCFDAAFASIKQMMWEQPYQDFMKSKRNSAASA